jgi:hypothetical protein
MAEAKNHPTLPPGPVFRARRPLFSRVLYIGAGAMLSVHGLYHVWADLMGIIGPQNPLYWLFGPHGLGQMMHIVEWPILFSALAVAFLSTFKK